MTLSQFVTRLNDVGIDTVMGDAVGESLISWTQTITRHDPPDTILSLAYEQGVFPNDLPWDDGAQQLQALLGQGPAAPERKYSPDQPRDDAGRWADGGGGGASGAPGAWDPAEGRSGAGRNDAEVLGAHLSALTTRPAKQAAVSLAAAALSDVSPGDLNSFVTVAREHAGDHPLGETPYNEPEQELNAGQALIDTWAHTAGDSNPVSLGLQEAAREIFELDQADHYAGMATGERTYQAHASVYDAFVRETYASTQAALAKAGVKEVMLYRGTGDVGLTPGTATVGALRLRPLSSFSTSDAVAVSFAHESWPGAVLAVKVPARNIFSMPGVGPGCLEEREVIVLGGTPSGLRLTVDSATYETEESSLRRLRKAMKAWTARPPAVKAATDLDPDLVDSNQVVTPDAIDANADWPKRTDDTLRAHADKDTDGLHD